MKYSRKLQTTEQQSQKSSPNLRLLVILLILGLAGSVVGQGVPNAATTNKVYPIDLYTTLRLAGQQSLKIAEAEARAREATGDQLSAFERFLPTLSADVVVLKHTGLTQGTEGEFVDVAKQSSRFGGSVTATWDLNEALFAVLSSRQQKRAFEEHVTVSRERSMQEAAFAYFDLVQASHLKHIAENSIRVSNSLVIQANSALITGVASGLDLLRAQGLLSRDSLLWYRADEEERAASAHLARVLNFEQTMQLTPLDTAITTFTLVDTGVSLNSWLIEAADGNPNISEQRIQVLSFRWQKRQATWGTLLPELSSRFSSTGFGRTFSDLHDSKDYTISARWILGPGGLFDVGRIRSHSARLDRARIQLEMVQDSVREMVVTSYESVKSRERMLEIARRALDEAKLLLQLLTDRRTMGVSRSLEVVLAAEEYESARIEHLRRVIDYNKAQITAMHAIGKLGRM